MKIEIENDTIRIKGCNVGKERHIKIYMRESGNKDYFSISVIKDGIEMGCIPSITMDKDFVIVGNEIKN